MAWLSITLELEPADAEALSEALMEEGADSVALDPAGARMGLTALADRDADAAALIAAAARVAGIAAPAFKTSLLDDDDWVRRTQAQFAPIRAGEKLWIVPSWHTPPEPDAVVLRLDPGLAFGTGSHPSTRLVLGFVEREVRGAGVDRLRVLDYGCGSGILAIAAAKLGARDVAGVDIDPQALDVTASNARDNGVAVSVAAPESLAAGTYDLVLANILAGPLIELEPLLAARVRDGGQIALSGILASQAEEVVAAYARDFSIGVKALEEGWVLIAGTRR